MAQIEEEKIEHQNKMLKMEQEMEDVMERKKQQKLKDSKTDLEQSFFESKEKLEQQKRELEARLAEFEQVCSVFFFSYEFLKSDMMSHGNRYR